jgi:hypothetical protein
MHIVSMTRFVLGIVFLAVALGVSPLAWKERGFGKFRQVAALALVAGGVFVARGLGLVDF